METESFTLVLTRGTHVIGAEAAATLTAALDRGLPACEIRLDLSGGLDAERTALVATGHIVALTRNPPRLPACDAQSETNVTALLAARARKRG